jgi:beclin
MYDKAAKDSTSPSLSRKGKPNTSAQINGTNGSTRHANPAMSFVMLTDSQVVPPQQTGKRDRNPAKPSQQKDVTAEQGQQVENHSLSQKMEVTQRLFEILSSRSDIDHPVCAECTELLIDGLQKRLNNAVRERDGYVEFLKKLNAEIPTEGEQEKAHEELIAFQAEQKVAFEELLSLEHEKGDVDAEIASLELEARHLDLEEDAFWRSRNAFAQTLSSFQNARDGVNLQYDHDSRQLERLQRTNVYNDTFCISHDGYFGTINGLRLGRLPNQSVEWLEINAAWGQTLLLLVTVAEKLDFTFEGYRLRPMGSTSRIDKLEMTENKNSATPSAPQGQPRTSPLDLYSSGEIPLGRMFMHRKFDAAMVAFLDCLRQLGEHVEQLPTTQEGVAQTAGGLKLPYAIKKDKIGDASIRLGFNQDEGWTRACKYTLTCCKFLLAHASNVAPRGNRGS